MKPKKKRGRLINMEFVEPPYEELARLIKKGKGKEVFEMFDKLVETEEYKLLPEWKKEQIAKKFWEAVDRILVAPAVIDLIREEAIKEIQAVLNAKDPRELGWKQSSNPDIFYKRIANYSTIFVNIKTKKWWEGDW